jgi:hypothetical protein
MRGKLTSAPPLLSNRLLMALGLESMLACPILKGKVQKAQAVSLGVGIYVGIAKVYMTTHDYSTLGYISYLIWVILIALHNDHQYRNQRSLVHCQELLDVLNVGLIQQCEDGTIKANKAAFDLLKLKRGDLASLQNLLDQHSWLAWAAQPGHWTSPPWQPIPKPSSRSLPKTSADGSQCMEYTSKMFAIYLLPSLDRRGDKHTCAGTSD